MKQTLPKFPSRFGQQHLRVHTNREFMKSGICDIGIIATADIARGISQPPFEKAYSAGVTIIALPAIDRDSAPEVNHEHIL